jgi:hypothetical protein
MMQARPSLVGALADSRLPEEKKALSEDEEETLQKKPNQNPVSGAMRPTPPHRSPRQAFGGNDNNQLLKLPQRKKILARNPLDKIPIAAAVSPPPKIPDDWDIVATAARHGR